MALRIQATSAGTVAAVQPRPAPKFVRGLMQDRQMLITGLIEHADLYHPDVEVVSRLAELPPSAPVHRTNYRTVHGRSKRLANALLTEIGVAQGTVVGTLAYNTFRHFECYYGISGIGAILHTVNPKLHLEQIEYICNHGEDDVLFVDHSCVPILLQLLDHKVITTRKFVIMVGEQHMPNDARLRAPGLFVWCYETLLARHSPEFVWPTFDENTASSLCYTSGTTGNPKGVLYSHRSTLLHTWSLTAADVFGVCSQDSILAIVPMYHANAWGMVYCSPMVGAKLVLPGNSLDGKSICDIILAEKVTFSFAVPTVFLGVFNHMDANKITSLGALNRVSIGGSSPPKNMIRRFMIDLGVSVRQIWGMTEMSPLGTTTGPWLAKHVNCTPEEKVDLACKAGRAVFGAAMTIVDDNGKELPRDGKTSGNLMVSGPWVVAAYHRLNKTALEPDGTFKTGDVATLDKDGFMCITDRSKDMIKTGGEWISSIDLENAASLHSSVEQVAVIGVTHPKWTERPLMIVVLKKGHNLTEAELLDFLSSRVAKWWVPEGVEFVDELPHTATGKIKKIDLRNKYADYKWRTLSTNAPIPSKL